MRGTAIAAKPRHHEPRSGGRSYALRAKSSNPGGTSPFSAVSIHPQAGKFASPRGVQRRSNMLEDSLFESQGRQKTRKPVVVVVSAVAHLVTIVVLVLIPLLQIQALPVPRVDLSLWLPHVQTPK